MRADGIPFGVTLLAPAGRDAQLACIGRVFHADTELPLGAQALRSRSSRRLPPCEQATRSRSPWSARIFPAWR